jgi:hypothetical protein
MLCWDMFQWFSSTLSPEHFPMYSRSILQAISRAFSQLHASEHCAEHFAKYFPFNFPSSRTTILANIDPDLYDRNFLQIL